MWKLKLTSTFLIDENPTPVTMSITSGVIAVRLVKTSTKSGVAVITDNPFTTFLIVCENNARALNMIDNFSSLAENRHNDVDPRKPIALHLKADEYCEYNQTHHAIQ